MPLVFEVLVTSLFLYFVCFTATPDDAQGLLLAGLVEPRRMLGLTLGQSSARQAPCLLYYLSGHSDFFMLKKDSVCSLVFYTFHLVLKAVPHVFHIQ